LAVHNYASSYGSMPPGYDIRVNGPHPRLLPYIEQDAMFRTYDLNGQFGPGMSSHFASALADNIPQATAAPQGRWGLLRPSPKTFICPSAVAPEEFTWLIQFPGVGYADIDFRGSLYGLPTGAGPRYSTGIYDNIANTIVVQNTATTNYLASRGYLTKDDPPDGTPYPGMFPYSKKATPATAFSTVGTPNGSGIALEAVADGTSNVIMFMETNGGFPGAAAAGRGTDGWVGENFGNAVFFADFGTCPDKTNDKADGLNCDFKHGGVGWGEPSLQHAGNRIMTAFGDGSVRALAPNLPFDVFVYLCGASDGFTVKFE